MKYLKIKENLLEQILLNKLNYLLVIDDKDDLSLNDDVELFNESNVTFGKARLNKIIVTLYRALKDSSPDLLSELEESYDDLGMVNDDSQIKVVYFDFDKYPEPKSISEGVDLDIESAKIYTDGGSRGNPGPSASGYVIMTMDNEVVKSNGLYLGVATNNQAEYNALKFALEDALEMGVKNATVYLDSLLVVNQINGTYKIKKQDLIPIFLAIKDLSKKFNFISFTHVPRELNKLADAEVNKCLDAYTQ